MSLDDAVKAALRTYMEQLKSAVDQTVTAMYEAEHLVAPINAILGADHPVAKAVYARVDYSFKLIHDAHINLKDATNEVSMYVRRLDS